MQGRDRRSDGRSRLLTLVRLRIADGPGDLVARIRDIAPGGVRVVCDAALQPRTPIEIELRNLGWVAGTIIWAADGEVGIRFAAPIDPDKARMAVSGSYAAPGSPTVNRRRL